MRKSLLLFYLAVVCMVLQDAFDYFIMHLNFIDHWILWKHHCRISIIIYYIKIQKQTNTPLWNMKQFGNSNHLICLSSLAYRGRMPKRAFLVESKENTSLLFFTISWKIKFKLTIEGKTSKLIFGQIKWIGKTAIPLA